VECLGLESQLGEEIVFFSKTVPTISGANPASYSGVPSLLVAGRPGCEADHSLPSSDKVKNEWSCTSAPPVYLMAWTWTALPVLIMWTIWDVQ